MDEQAAWTMFFASVHSMQYHPGAGTKEHQRLSARESARVADGMLREWKRRWGPVYMALGEEESL